METVATLPDLLDANRPDGPTLVLIGAVVALFASHPAGAFATLRDELSLVQSCWRSKGCCEVSGSAFTQTLTGESTPVSGGPRVWSTTVSRGLSWC